MPTVPVGYAAVTMPLTHAGLARSAAVTYGIYAGLFSGSASELADAAFDLFATDIGDLIDSNVTIGPAHVQWNDGGGIFSGDGTETSPGGLSDNTQPPSVAVLIRKSTAAPGRSGRGRMYLPWAATDASVDELGILDGAAQAVMQTKFDSWRSNSQFADLFLTLLHAGAGTPAAITALTVDGRVATQRRRLR